MRPSPTTAVDDTPCGQVYRGVINASPAFTVTEWPRKYTLSTVSSPEPTLAVWDGPERLCWRNTYPLDALSVDETLCKETANTDSRSPSPVVSVTAITNMRELVVRNPSPPDVVLDAPLR